MIVGSVKIDQFISKVFQDRQGCGRAIDKLAIAAARGKRSLKNEILATRLDAGFNELRIQFLQFFPRENGLDCA